LISLAPPKGKEVLELRKLPKVYPSFPPVVNKAKKEITYSGGNQAKENMYWSMFKFQ
jgi:hypothetical protein